MSFTHLRWHSTFSFLEGIGKLDDLLSIVEKLGMTSVALTEYYNMSGVIPFFQKATKKNIKPIIGVELGFTYDYKTIHHHKQLGNITLIAKSTDGYKALLRLVTLSQRHIHDNKPVIDLATIASEFAEYCTKGTIYALIGGERSCIWQMIMKYDELQKIRDLWEIIRTTFWSDAFLADLIAQPYQVEPQLKRINNQIQALALATDTPLLVNPNFHYLKIDDKEVFEVALAIKDGKKMYDTDRRRIPGNYHISDETFVVQTMLANGYTEDVIQKMMQTNNNVAATIDVTIHLGQKLFPIYQTPPDMLALYEKHKEQLVVRM